MEKVSISGGKFITGGIIFGQGNRDNPLHLKREPNYIKQLHHARRKHVVFYDVETRRAWFLNGASALLHLVRACLTYAGSHELFSRGFKFRFEDLYEPVAEHKETFAFEVLEKPHNRDLIIYEDWKPGYEATLDADGAITEVTKLKDGHFRFRDQVDEIYHILEQIQEFQIKMTDTIRFTARDRIEGFDFMDIATGEDPIHPRAMHLRSSGRGWVDFTRSLNAVTLFGGDFGELFKPAEGSNKLCKPWAQVPIGRDFLAASISDLAEILKKNGKALERSMKLINGIYWHKADKLFESCECEVPPSRKAWKLVRSGTTCDRVQVLLPPSLGRKGHPGPLEIKGAVIFGKSEKYKLHWPNQGNPKEPGAEEADSDSESNDETEPIALLPRPESSSIATREASEVTSPTASRTPLSNYSEIIPSALSAPRTLQEGEGRKGRSDASTGAGSQRESAGSRASQHAGQR
jgi:hypothetical protein